MIGTVAILDEFDRPIRVTEREVPEPEAGAMLAEVLYAGVCGTDLHLQAGHLEIPTPIVLGHEAVGRLIQLGPDVAEDADGQPLRVGDLIGWASSIVCGDCELCGAGTPTLCEARRVYGINRAWGEWPHFSGAWASVIYLQPGTTVVRPTVGLSPRAIIALGCAGPTAVHGFRRLGEVAGATVIVQGAGPVGVASALYAKHHGADRVIMIGGPTHRLAIARELSVADMYLDIEVEPDPSRRASRARRLLGSHQGSDVVIECTGVPSAVSEGMDLCRPGGRYLVLGQYTDRGPTPINPHLVTRKQLAVLGSWAFSAADYVEYLRSLPALLKLADLERLVEVFALSDANRAMDRVRSGAVVKAALAP